MAQKAVYTTPELAEAAYYRAFEQADLDAMMGVWSEREDVVCVHPLGGRLLRGQHDVLESWVHLFARELDMQITLTDRHKTLNGDIAIHSGIENIQRLDDPEIRGRVLVTNVFRREGEGWHMIVHHATPAARPQTVSAPAGFEQESEPHQVH